MKIGDLEKDKETARVVKPQVDLETYPSARVREGEDEFTLRMEEKEGRSDHLQHTGGRLCQAGPAPVGED